MIAAGSVISIDASMDNHVHALDVRDGNEHWQADVSTPTGAIPATCIYQGMQYIGITVGGNLVFSLRIRDEIAAYRLPQGN